MAEAHKSKSHDPIDLDSHDDDGGMGHHKKPAEEGEGPWLVSYADLMTLLMGFFALIASMSTIDTQKLESVKESTAEAFGTEYEKPYEKLAQEIEKFIKENHLEDKVQVTISPNGAEMTFTGTMFFDSGDFKVKQDAADIMAMLAQIIKSQPEPFKALIEGHTDGATMSHPILSSNWELSGVRAARIAQIFERKGFKKDQLTIIGWGETRRIASEVKADNSQDYEGMSKNRRVVLRVYDSRVSNDPVQSHKGK